MDNQLTPTNRINDQLSSLRGVTVGSGQLGRAGERVDRFGLDGFGEAASRVAQRVTPVLGVGAAAGRELGEAVPRMVERINDKISRDGVVKAGVDVVKHFGNHVREDLSANVEGARSRINKVGQMTGEFADKISNAEFRKEPISTLSGLAANGLKRAGLYTPADSSTSRENSVVK